MWARRFIKRCLAYILFEVVNYKQQLPNVNVLNSFKKKYKRATYVTWELFEGNLWEASFLQDMKEQKALFKEDGEWLKTSTHITLGNVPKKVSNGFYQNAPSTKHKMTFLLDTPNGVYYEFVVNLPNEPEIILYDVHGKLVENNRLQMLRYCYKSNGCTTNPHRTFDPY